MEGTVNGTVGDNVLIRSYNRLVQTTIANRLKNLDNATSLNEKYYEIGDCRYLLDCSKEDKNTLYLSFGMSCGQQLLASFLADYTLHRISQACVGFAEQIPPVPGCVLSLKVDLTALAALAADQQARGIKALASLHSMVAGTPLRKLFQELKAGNSQPGPLQTIAIRPGDSWFVQRGADRITCIFPIRCVRSEDASIATAFLQEFSEAKRGTMRTSLPIVMHHPAKSPPAELRELSEEDLGAPPACYMSFAYFQHQLTGGRVEDIIWNMCSFQTLVQYHVQTFKSWMHSRMRARMDQMLLDLGAATTRK